MKAPFIKTLLDSLVAPEERDFEIRFVRRPTRRVSGSYRYSTRTIKIVRRNNDGWFDLIGTGLHELAHHLNFKRGQIEWRLGPSGQRRGQYHGAAFLGALVEVTQAFNRRFCRHHAGKMVCDAKRLRQSPFFLTAEEVLFQLIVERRQFAGYASAFPEFENEASGASEACQ